MHSLIPLVAGGNIKPSRFIKVDTTQDNHGLQAGSGDVPIGISQKGQRNTPYASLQDGYCAISGESFRYFGIGDTAPLALGGTVTAGDYLKPDSDGRGVTATTGNAYGAKTAVAGAIEQIIEVQVLIGYVP